MTYQALARKWRPGRFADVVGQEHVVTALSFALDQDRVHHAFLFTGTRGVGKTTLARLLAKSLNCETGVSSNPCGECSSCQSVDQGRFVDLLEVDAASRTRVDDTRELLDNVQYAPTMGRYKVYLIDEVHMLSGHSFNALLKTLEEPPPHVKFLLATTDPQKLPATILSRCLQFNLRALNAEEIAGQMAQILKAEGIDHDNEALELLARSAQGSMRDGLSLLDQSIAYSGSSLSGEAVRRMLGMIESDYIAHLVRAAIDSDSKRLFETIETMRERNIGFENALDDVILLLHEMALMQQVPEVVLQRGTAWSDSGDLAASIAPETLQLYYQIALHGKRDLVLAPDTARGFEMVFLRMLAFRPGGPQGSSMETPGAGSTPHFRKSETTAATHRTDANEWNNVATMPTSDRKAAMEQLVSTQTSGSTTKFNASSWGTFVESCDLRGIARELAMNLGFDAIDGKTLKVSLDSSISHLNSSPRVSSIEKAIAAWCGQPLSLKIDLVDSISVSTPAEQRDQRIADEKQQALDGMMNDPVVNDFINEFGAEVVPESIEPATQRGNQ